MGINIKLSRTSLTLYFVICCLFMACTSDKHEPEYTLGQTYMFEKAEYSDYRGYIKGKELTASETEAFIGDNWVLDVPQNTSPVSDTIYFRDNKKVEYNRDPDVFSWKYSRNKNTIVLQTDTIPGSLICHTLHSCKTFDNMLVWKKDSVGIYYIASAELRSQNLYKKEYTLEGEKLVVPLLICKYTYHPSRPLTNYYSVSIRLENKFDKNVLTGFMEGDTLAVMEGRVIYKKLL